MTEAGEVIAIEGRSAVVRFTRKEACGRCNMCMFRRDSMNVDMKMENVAQAEIGDRVEVEMSTGFVLTAALLVYALPLLFAGIGLAIGLLFSNELYQLLLCLGFLAVGYIIVILLDKKFRMTRKVMPVMTRIIAEEKRDDT